MKYQLYRHYDSDKKLLYVGISLSSISRLGQHKVNSHWFDSISYIKIEKCTDKSDALSKERFAILKEKPIHNISCNSKYDIDFFVNHVNNNLFDGSNMFIDTFTGISNKTGATRVIVSKFIKKLIISGFLSKRHNHVYLVNKHRCI